MSRPFIPLPNGVSAELIMSFPPAIVWENVFHIVKATPFTLAQIQSLRGALDTFDSATYKTIRSSFANLTRIRIKALDSLASPFEDYALPTPRAGTLSTGTVFPLNVAICIKLTTGLTGRSARGRCYVSGFGVNQQGSTANVITTTFGTACVNALTSLITAVNAWDSTAHLSIASFRSGNAWRGTAVAYTVTNASITDYIVKSQRRRTS